MSARGAPLEKELIKGVLDLMVLSLLRHRSREGIEIARGLRSACAGTLSLPDGSLYPALHRLRDRGLISSRPGLNAGGRRCVHHEITRAGDAALRRYRIQWKRIAACVVQLDTP